MRTWRLTTKTNATTEDEKETRYTIPSALSRFGNYPLEEVKNIPLVHFKSDSVTNVYENKFVTFKLSHTQKVYRTIGVTVCAGLFFQQQDRVFFKHVKSGDIDKNDLDQLSTELWIPKRDYNTVLVCYAHNYASDMYQENLAFLINEGFLAKNIFEIQKLNDSEIAMNDFGQLGL